MIASQGIVGRLSCILNMTPKKQTTTKKRVKSTFQDWPDRERAETGTSIRIFGGIIAEEMD